MSELARLLDRGSAPTTIACRTIADWEEEYFAEQCRWAAQVDDLNDEVGRYWRATLRVRLAWTCAASGWACAIFLAALWWRSLHG